jgi:hypothetical protein
MKPAKSGQIVAKELYREDAMTLSREFARQNWA